MMSIDVHLNSMDNVVGHLLPARHILRSKCTRAKSGLESMAEEGTAKPVLEMVRSFKFNSFNVIF